ncbi:MAG: hypothetical protein HOE62_17615 [Alphaproteobacteria bacterium]|nr:hypothetical protein [Alphaproteobacteria bacterium]MBT4019775.1 hypothetical protein [Alphaproteobacteria bacterium]MBT5158173.1 hypothetical protein [Alphaproteobacteria bacterium]MBT5919498.1 hypothetical protein [Alphaproteobacteria bacterium]MBT6387841.1 hypothetical protein [Alphaproteobacteria bacterium]
MADDRKTQHGKLPPVPGSRNPARNDRLTSELRDNLKRRKGQSRSRGEDTPPGAASRTARKTLIDPE